MFPGTGAKGPELMRRFKGLKKTIGALFCLKKPFYHFFQAFFPLRFILVPAKIPGQPLAQWYLA